MYIEVFVQQEFGRVRCKYRKIDNWLQNYLKRLLNIRFYGVVDWLPYLVNPNILWRRMHPSRMRTVRCSGCLGGYLLGGASFRRGVSPGGCVFVQRGVCLGDVSVQGCVYSSMQWGRLPPPPPLTNDCENITVNILARKLHAGDSNRLM